MKKASVQYNSRQYYMHTANALAPEYYEQEEVTKRPQKRPQVQNKPKAQPKAVPRKHFLALTMPSLSKIAIVFVMGVLLVAQYAYINSLGYSISQAQDDLTVILAENERLKQEYAQLGNLEAIEAYATVNLGMVRPEENVAYLPERQVGSVSAATGEETVPKTEDGFLTTIKGILGSFGF